MLIEATYNMNSTMWILVLKLDFDKGPQFKATSLGTTPSVATYQIKWTWTFEAFLDACIARSSPGYQTLLQRHSSSGHGCWDEQFSSALCHTGRPFLRCSVCFPGDAALLFKAEESRGLMCQHPGFPPGRCNVNVIPKKLMFLWRPFYIC